MRKKLFLSTLAIILVTLGLSMFAVNFVFTRQFTDYLTSANEATLEQLPARLTSLYQSKGRWDSADLDEISHSLPIGTVVTLTDPSGKTIATLNSPMENMMYGSGSMGMGMGMGMSMGMSYSVQEWKTKTLAITGTQGLIATALVRYPASARILNPQDVHFVSEVLRSLLLAGGLALIFGILLSFWTSRRLVSPLQRLTQAAYRIGQGNLDERVSIITKDEVGQLANAFNAMADSLNQQERLRKQFTADIAHELRTPLTSMKSYVEAFLDGVLPMDEENLTALNEEIDRLVGLSSDLKDLNVAEIGALTVNNTPFDLKILLDKVVRNLSPLILEREITLNWDTPAHSVEIWGDQRLLTRLFYNLIHNAYKYTEPGGQITVRLYSKDDLINVTVQDTGIGIPEADLPFVFERFYRTDKSRNRETGGTGIGLALVRQIALLHKGDVTVKSNVGQGTLFTVNLPRVQKEAKE